MYTVLLVMHTIVVLFLIGLVLIQRPESDGLGSLGGGGGNLLSGRSAGNMLTRITAILATIFIVSSLTLAIMSGHNTRTSIIDAVEEEQPAATEGAPAPEKAPAKADKLPSVPKPE